MKRIISITVAGTVVAVLAIWSVRASGQAKPAAPPSKPTAATQSQARRPVNMPPMPFGPRDPLPRPSSCRDISSANCVASVFKFAAEHPEVLKYVPCFCGCEHLGHKGNDDCFVKARAANGDVIAWEPHGTECQVCLDVGMQAMQMYSSGASPREIRAEIEKKYAGSYKNHTPTPHPPAPAK